MKRFPVTVSTTLLLIALDALMWFAFGVVVAAGGLASIVDPPALRWGMAILAWAAASALAALVFMLTRRSRLAFWAAVLLLMIIAILSMTDQVGWSDLTALAFSVIPLVLLIRDRAWYLAPRKPGSHD